MVHSFTCAGVLPTQYIKLCNFAKIGTAGQRYIRKGKNIIINQLCILPVVYNEGGYVDLVGRMVEECLQRAVMEVKGLPQYAADGGEVSKTFKHFDAIV